MKIHIINSQTKEGLHRLFSLVFLILPKVLRKLLTPLPPPNLSSIKFFKKIEKFIFILDYSWSLILNGLLVSLILVAIILFLWRKPIKRIFNRIRRLCTRQPFDTNEYFTMGEEQHLIGANASSVQPQSNWAETGFENVNLNFPQNI